MSVENLLTLVIAEFVVILVLVLFIVWYARATSSMLPEGVVKDLLSHVGNAGVVVAEEGLARVEAVTELTETQVDDMAVDIGKRVLAGLRRDMDAANMVVAQAAPPEDAKSAPTTVIVVNGREKVVPKNDMIFYEEVIRLAFDNPPVNSDGISVIYTRGDGGKPSGTLSKGQSAKIKSGMVFDAAFTGSA